MPLPPPNLTAVSTPKDVMEGSPVVASFENLSVNAENPELVITDPVSGTDYTYAPLDRDGNDIRYKLDATIIAGLGLGTHELFVVAQDARKVRSKTITIEVNVVDKARIIVTSDLKTTPVLSYWNASVPLEGNGFLFADEGTMQATWEGQIDYDSGNVVPISGLKTSAGAAPGTDRTKGFLKLSSALGEIFPGKFTGTITLSSQTLNGAQETTAPIDVEIVFQKAIVTAFASSTSNTGSVGQRIRLIGGGFIDEPASTGREAQFTVVSIDGVFEDAETGLTSDVSTLTIDTTYINDQELGFFLDGCVSNDKKTCATETTRDSLLISKLFGAHAGEFRGIVTPTTFTYTGAMYAGEPSNLSFTVTPPAQAVELRFIDDFYESLERYGVRAAAGEIEARVRDRVQNIWDRYNVYIFLEPPEDFQLFAVIEVGGKDPTGIGLLGLDNSPGKDIGNIRLTDKVGGVNAITIADCSGRCNGFGGVFIENYLFFSSHPDLPYEVQSKGLPDKLFDEVFDGVRQNAISEADLAGETSRTAEVEKAIEAIANMIGETIAHELGHSMGLARPSLTQEDCEERWKTEPTFNCYHQSAGGNLMASGGSRRLNARISNLTPHFSTTSATYLDEIVGRKP